MYEVYFCWVNNEHAPLWHPINLPDLTEDEARSLASAMQKAMPSKRWAFGPKWLNGVTEIV